MIARQTSKVVANANDSECECESFATGGVAGGTPGSPRRAVSVVLLETLYI
jgi:hypothetical protein